MSSDYDNIDFCLNTLYDFMYNFDKSSGCYRFRRIQAKNINITHIKKDKRFDVSSVLNADINYIGKDMTTNDFLFERKSETSYNSLVKIGKYNISNTNYDDLKRGELVDMIISYIFSELIVDDQLKFTMLPIMNFDINYNNLEKINDNISKKIKTDKSSDMLYVKVMERYHEMVTLEEYLTSNSKDEDLKKIIFQVLYALFKIQVKYPNFRHNNLGLNSIYLYKDDSRKKINLNVIGTQMEIEKPSYLIKISNYQESCIPGIVDNTDTNKVDNNPYYDMHFFLNSLYLYLNSNNKLSFVIKTFISSVIPDNFLIKEGKFNGIDEAYYNAEVVDVQTPMIVLLKNNFFSEFIKNKGMESSPTMSNTPKSLNSFGIKENSIDYSISTSITHDSQSPLLLAKEIKNRKRLSKYNNKDGSMKKISSNNQKSIKGNRALKMPKTLKSDKEEDEVFRYSETGLTVTEAQVNDSSDSPVRTRSKHLLSVTSDGISETSAGRPNLRTEELSATSFEGQLNDDDDDDNVDDEDVEIPEEQEEVAEPELQEELVTTEIDVSPGDIEPTEKNSESDRKKKKHSEKHSDKRASGRKKSSKSSKTKRSSTKSSSTSSFSFGNMLDSTSERGSVQRQENRSQKGNKFMRLFNETNVQQGQMNPGMTNGMNPGMNPMAQMYQMIDQHQQQMPQVNHEDGLGNINGNSYFTNSVERTILDRLGDNYEGELPDLYQYNLPMPGEFGANTGMMQGMSGFNLPPQGMPLHQPGFDMNMMNQYGSDMLPQMSMDPLPQHLQMNGSMNMMGGEKKGLFF